MRVLFLVNELLTVCGVSKHFYHLLKGLKELYPEQSYYVICGGGDIEALNKFKALDVPIIVNPKMKHETRSFAGYFIGVKDIYQFIRKNKIDVIHSHHHYSASIASKAAKITATKTILTNHGILPEIGILSHFCAESIIVINEHVKEYLLKNNIKPDERIHLIPHGFPIKKTIKKTIKNRDKKIKVLTGGRFVKDKCFDVYIKAISNLTDKVKNKAEFYIAGAGEEEDSLSKLNNLLGSNIEFLGKVNDFPAKLEEMDVFVMASKFEGFPTILIEAGLAHNLIITSNFLGLSFVLSSKHAMIFDIDNVKLLSNYLEKAILYYDDFSDQISAFNKLVITQFTQKKMIKRTFELYSQILDKK